MDAPIIRKTVDDLMKEAKQFSKKQDEREIEKSDKKGLSLDPLKLFYRKTEAGMRKPSRITFETLRRMSKSCDIARLCINTLKHEISKTKWAIVPVDPKDVPDKKKIKEMEHLFNFPNSDENFRKFLEKILEDILALDAGAIELVDNAGGNLSEMFYIDGSTIRPSYDINGNLGDPAYFQMMPLNNTAKPDTEFSRDELVYIMQNPQGDIKNFGYGLSPLEGVIMVATNILNADNYNGSFFEVGTLPPLLINLGENISSNEVEAFRDYWKAEVEGKPWKTAFLGGVQKPEVMDLQKTTNRDMQFMEYNMWLSKLMVAAYEMSPQDIGLTFEINKATAEVQREISKAKGYKSLLELLKEVFTQEIIWKRFGYTDLMFDWQDVDLVDAETRARIFEIESKAGAKSINEYRKEIGLDPIKGGIQPFIMVGQTLTAIDSTPLEDISQDEAEEEQEKAQKDVDATGDTTGCGGARVETGMTKFNDSEIKGLDRKLGFSWEDYSIDEFKMGMKEELEHKDITHGNLIQTAKIVLAHLKEDKEYYTKLKDAFNKTVQTGNYLCWMDDRGYGQPFAWTDSLETDGYYIKPPVAVNLNGPDDEVRITHELADKGLNVVVENKVSKKDIDKYLPSTKLKEEFGKYCRVAPEYYSRKWEMKWGKTRDYPFYVVGKFVKGFNLTDKRLLDDMKRDPTSYRQAITDLSKLWLVEKEMDLGDRRANQYLITPDKRAWGFDYQFEGGDSHTWEEYKDEIKNALKTIPELQDLFLTLTNQEIKKKINYIINKAVQDFYQNKITSYQEDLTAHINNKLKAIYSEVIAPKIKEVKTAKQITKDWTDDVNEKFKGKDKEYQIEETKKKSKLYEDIFKQGLYLSAYLLANKMGKPSSQPALNKYVESKMPEFKTDWQKIYAERSAATSKSVAMTLNDNVKNYLARAQEQGLDSETMTEDLKSLIGYEDSWRAKRVVSTESAWANKEASKAMAKAIGADQYYVEYGSSPCEECLDAFGDGEGPFEEKQIDEIPLHCNCECSSQPLPPDNFDIDDLE